MASRFPIYGLALPHPFRIPNFIKGKEQLLKAPRTPQGVTDEKLATEPAPSTAITSCYMMTHKTPRA